MSDAKKPPQEEENLYRAPGPPVNVFDGYSTLNTQGARPAIDDRECWWLDGFMPIGRSYIRTLPGVGPPIFVAGHLVPPGPTPPPPIIIAHPAIYITGQSCELFRFPLTATGVATPAINITGTTSTLTGPRGNLLSNTLAVDVDSSGNQYVLQQNLQLAGGWVYSIPIFAQDANGDPAPIRNIVGPATGLPISAEANFGGICLDAGKNIYAGISNTTHATDVWKFTAGSNGNATGTLIITDTTLILTSLCYDAVNNLIWVSGYTTLGGAAQAQSYTTAGVLHSTLTTTAMIFPGEVFIGPSGQIILSGTSPSDGTKTVVQVFPIGSSGAAVASQTITISAPQGPQVSCVAMDSAGLLYVGPVFVGINETINVYAAGATGTNPATLRTFTSPLFSHMADGSPTNITNIVIRSSGVAITQGNINAIDPWFGNLNHAVPHGLPSGPTILSVYLQCKIAEHGYNIGDIVQWGEDIANQGGGSIWTVSADGTNTYITTNSFGATPGLTSRDTNTNFSITAANWKLVVIPYLVQ